MFSFQIIQDIPVCKDAAYLELIEGGFSHDVNVLVYTKHHEYFLVRVGDASNLKVYTQEYEFLKRCETLNDAFPKPIDFGVLEQHHRVYRVYTWMEGVDLVNVLPTLDNHAQYACGVEAGQLLKAMHSINCDDTNEDWETLYNHKIDQKIQAYHLCGLRYPDDASCLKTIEAYRPYLNKRPSVYQHGDYHGSNMIYNPHNRVSIIDFNRVGVGDPWEEFNRIIWSVKVSEPFACGQIHGYFNQEPPLEFFKLLKLYSYVNAIASLPWAIPLGQEQIDIMHDNYQIMRDWYRDDSEIPTWYQTHGSIKKKDD